MLKLCAGQQRIELTAFNPLGNVMCVCSALLPRPQLVAMVELVCLMNGLMAQLREAEEWLLPLLHQGMHSLAQGFVMTTLPGLNRQGSASKVAAPLSSLQISPCLVRPYF